ncbi:MAG: transposase domain-containing protein [Acetobacteraceae bacterium]|jgi:hypothetical protein|nr:transposase domain-containing protein [Acetobacteraceae bacterium]
MLNGIDPHHHFTEALTRLVNGCPNSRTDERITWRWAAVEER